MRPLRRIIYLAYYLWHVNWPLLRRFMEHTKTESSRGLVRQSAAVVRDSLRFNISPLEWYQFGFVSLTPDEKAAWAGTGTMYEFQLRANPPNCRSVLIDKRRFYRAYREFFEHSVWSVEELELDASLARRVLEQNDRLVFKDATGNCGKTVRVVATEYLDVASLTKWMTSEGFDLAEGYVQQHPDLQTLSPTGVNTVRIVTLIDLEGGYHLLGCRLRISVDSPVDNLAAGNLAAPIDESSGVVNGPGVYSDITRNPEPVHPVTGTPIEGFRVPFWRETLELVKQASRKHPENRSVGWDVVVTPDGPGLIEGNHDWCKLVWQLPVQSGLKHLLEGEP